MGIYPRGISLLLELHIAIKIPTAIRLDSISEYSRTFERTSDASDDLHLSRDTREYART